MLGAILGDIIGSPYEFTRYNIKTTEFPLFSEQSEFTDDTVMTLAVAEGLMNGGNDEDAAKAAIIAAMRKYGKMYPRAGYGQRFAFWLFAAEDPEPYGSYGNGSAMRVSSVAWLFDDLAAVERFARISAEVTHNHPEGIKGAQATAGAIFMARKGESKAAVRRYTEKTGRRAVIEYTLVGGVNDGLAHAEELAQRLRGMNCLVNLIPLNPVAERPELAPPPEKHVWAFGGQLTKLGCQNTVRRSLGEDIQGACGQLRRKHLLAATERASALSVGGVTNDDCGPYT